MKNDTSRRLAEVSPVERQMYICRLAVVKGYLEGKMCRPGYRPVTEAKYQDIEAEVSRATELGARWNSECESDYLKALDASTAVGA